MSDNQRHRRELANPRYFDVNSATVIEIGDLCWLDTDDVKPASDFTWNASLAQTQEDFALKFIGMSADRSRSDDTDQVAVDKNGVKEFTCASATFEIGDLVGPAKASGNALENQKVAAVALKAQAIGRVAKRYASATTTVEVEIFTYLDNQYVDSPMTGADIVAAVEAEGTLTADAIVDGVTNHVFTALDDTKLTGIEANATADQTAGEIKTALETLAGAARLDADYIKDGATNVMFTVTDQTKLGLLPTKVFFDSRTVSAAEAAANLVDIDTGFTTAPTGWIVQVLRAGVNVTEDAIITNPATDIIRVADGAATYNTTENDVINTIAWQA